MVTGQLFSRTTQALFYNYKQLPVHGWTVLIEEIEMIAQDSVSNGCKCPQGFHGDGLTCEDINECKVSSVCQCSGCRCKNSWGGYKCSCSGDRLYINDQDTCIERSGSKTAWWLTLLILSILTVAGLAGYLFYKYRFRSYMDSEIMTIMSQYMPLHSQRAREVPSEAEPFTHNSTV